MLAISARFAPLPPSRFFISLVPSALPPPKKYVRLPAFFKTAALALTLIPFLRPFLWPFLSATFLGFSDLDLFLARLGMGAYLPCPGPPRKVISSVKTTAPAVRWAPDDSRPGADGRAVGRARLAVPGDRGRDAVFPHLDRPPDPRSEEHTSELQSLRHLVCRLLL